MKREIEKRKKIEAAAAVIAVVLALFVVGSVPVIIAGDGDPNPVFISEVTVWLNATDGEGGSGIDYTMYTISYEPPGGPSSQTTEIEYTGPFNVSGLGNYTISYYSVDMASNVEEIKVTSFSIVGDITPPVTTCILEGTLH